MGAEGEPSELDTLLEEVETVIAPTDVQECCLRLCTLLEAMAELRPDYDNAALKKDAG